MLSLKHTFFLILSYKQQKFNLFREETEGYAKLITELTSNELGRSSKDSVMQNIFSLLGRIFFMHIL